MKQTDDLTLLHSTLTGSERRYFRVQAQRSGQDNKYLLLFDELENRNLSRNDNHADGDDERKYKMITTKEKL